MSEEIKELDITKYLVLKWEDVIKLPDEDVDKLNDITQQIREYRASKGKDDNKYLVLNIEDEISLDSLINSLKYWYISGGEFAGTYHDVRVKRIAVALVNAILKTKT